MASQLQPQKQSPWCDGAYPDPDVVIFGGAMMEMDGHGAAILPGSIIYEAWSEHFYEIMLKAAQDKDLESKDKND